MKRNAKLFARMAEILSSEFNHSTRFNKPNETNMDMEKLSRMVEVLTWVSVFPFRIRKTQKSSGSNKIFITNKTKLAAVLNTDLSYLNSIEIGEVIPPVPIAELLIELTGIPAIHWMFPNDSISLSKKLNSFFIKERNEEIESIRGTAFDDLAIEIMQLDEYSDTL